jgi:hypothetical protein
LRRFEFVLSECECLRKECNLIVDEERREKEKGRTGTVFAHICTRSSALLLLLAT